MSRHTPYTTGEGLIPTAAIFTNDQRTGNFPINILPETLENVERVFTPFQEVKVIDRGACRLAQQSCSLYAGLHKGRRDWSLNARLRQYMPQACIIVRLPLRLHICAISVLVDGRLV
ncbi:hypothetical protein KM043_014667 [Ampulex compressa]|nr:hypothetical protein KM043_014667 [Ampulex compressa]